jgi:hypothetical protein
MRDRYKLPIAWGALTLLGGLVSAALPLFLLRHRRVLSQMGALVGSTRGVSGAQQTRHTPELCCQQQQHLTSESSRQQPFVDSPHTRYLDKDWAQPRQAVQVSETCQGLLFLRSSNVDSAVFCKSRHRRWPTQSLPRAQPCCDRLLQPGVQPLAAFSSFPAYLHSSHIIHHHQHSTTSTRSTQAVAAAPQHHMSLMWTSCSSSS